MDATTTSPKPDDDSNTADPLPGDVECMVYEACFGGSPAAAVHRLVGLYSRHRAAIEALAGKVLRASDLLGELQRHATAGGVAAVPERIGDYRIERQLGQGGFGVVFLAEQTGSLRRQVALKLLRSDVGGDEVLDRFEGERRALAAMDHPGIARIFDAGRTATGQPFFAMEYIAGEPMVEYCNRRRRSIPERLHLFLDVCGAVLHAHQRGLVHRDLKPGNVLIVEHDARAYPKVIDFGLAKAIGPDPDLGRIGTTMTGRLVGTPEYMAPEQACGGSIDTRTDVYSLGVLLFELLTGSLPFPPAQLRAQGLSSVARTLAEVAPPRLSAAVGEHVAPTHRVAPATLRRRLRGDLEAIVGHCLEKQPGARYPGVSELAADLRRHLAHETISVRPLGLAGSLRRLASRHRAVFAGSVVALLALLVAVAATTWSLWRVTDSRDRAVAAAVRADARSYAAAIQAAARAGDACRGPDMRASLELAPVDHRNIEWQLLAAQTNDARAVARLEVARGRSVVTVGSRVVVVAEGGLVIFDPATGSHHPWPWQLPAWVSCGAADAARTTLFLAFGDGSVQRQDGQSEPRTVARLAGGESALAVGRAAAWFVINDGNDVVGLPGDGGPELFRWQGTCRPCAFAITPDDGQIAIAWSDGRVEVRRRATGQVVQTAPHPRNVHQMVFPTESRLVTTGYDEVIRLWHLDRGLLAAEQPTGAHNMCALVGSEDGTMVVSGGADGSVRYWDAATLRYLGHARGHASYVCGIDRLPDGSFVSYSWDRELRIWPAAPPRRAVPWLGLHGSATRRCLHPHAPIVFVGTLACEVGAFDVPGGGLRWRRRLDGRYVHGIDVTPDGRRLLVTTWAGSVHVLDSDDGRSLERYDVAEPETLGNVVVVRARSEVLVAERSVLHRFAAADMTPLKPLPITGFEAALLVEIAAAPSGDQLVATSADAHTVLLDVATGRSSWSRTGLQIGQVVFAPDGRRLFAASRLGYVLVLDRRNGDELFRFGKGSQYPVGTLAVTEDGRRVIASDQQLRIWDCERGDELLALDGLRFTPLHPLVLPHANLLLTTSGHFDAPAEILAWSIHPSRLELR